MKDPAVLFYFQDFLVGTEFMTDDEVGKYIRILCHQADKGALSKTMLLRICRTNQVPDAIMEKLHQDENGNYYQNRMKIEREKRISYSDSRRKNREIKQEDMNNICETYDTHMENENININKDINEDKECNTNTWKTDFQIYLSECRAAYKKFMEDSELLKTQQRLNPGIDIKLSIEKGFVNFWSTEAGWKHKKKSRIVEIDWKATIINSIDLNKVYLLKKESTGFVPPVKILTPNSR